MSVKTMGAVFELDLPARLKWILMCLADHADDDGTRMFPSVARLARKSNTSERTVQRALRDLEALGFIEPYTEPLNTLGTVAYRFTFMEGRQIDTPVIPAGVTPVTPRGDTRVTGGVTPVTPRGDTRVTQTISNHQSTISNHHPEFSFSAFWDVFPRHAGRPTAARAWAKAIKRAEPKIIIEKAAAYAADPNRDDAFTAHPATWLNRDGWNDDPLPAASARKASSVKNILALQGGGKR